MLDLYPFWNVFYTVCIFEWYYRSIFINLILDYVCVWGGYLHVSTGARGVFSEVLDCHELELEAGVSYSDIGAGN